MIKILSTNINWMGGEEDSPHRKINEEKLQPPKAIVGKGNCHRVTENHTICRLIKLNWQSIREPARMSIKSIDKAIAGFSNNKNP